MSLLPSSPRRVSSSPLRSHSHPFESRALILAGEITLSLDGRERRYACAEIFHLAHGALHQERYGPTGVRYLVGPKEPPGAARHPLA
jgi:quercetin dioxygenase-like cupin family protein